MPNKTVPPLFLASQSPRRKELLGNVNLQFSVYVPKSAELSAPKTKGKEGPANIVRRIAKAKARAAYTELVNENTPSGVILSADTLVFLKQKVLGKPADRADAVKMLKQLSGKTHIVATAVHVLLFEGRKIIREQTIVVKTKVTFFRITAKDLAWYLETGEPFDKAGSYGAQSFGSALIESFQGSYTNVVGLPVGETLQLLQTITKEPWQAWLKIV